MVFKNQSVLPIPAILIEIKFYLLGHNYTSLIVTFF